MGGGGWGGWGGGGGGEPMKKAAFDPVSVVLEANTLPRSHRRKQTARRNFSDNSLISLAFLALLASVKRAPGVYVGRVKLET